MIEIGPGEPAQLVHCDQWAFDFFPFPAGFEVECHTMWAMNDFTKENGATRVIPGSNHWEDKLRPPEDLARLAGYRRGAYALGYYGDLQDPFDAVRGSAIEGPASFSVRE